VKTKKLMTKDVWFCEPSTSLNDAAHEMWEHDVGCLPVVDGRDDRRVVGMITDRDICMAAYHQGKSLKDLHVADAMSQHIVACRPEDEVEDAEQRMRAAQVRRLPVVDTDNRLVGILSLGQIALSAGNGGNGPLSEHEVALTLAAICTPVTPRS